jgi:uncharacterized protein (TIGR02246 family)
MDLAELIAREEIRDLVARYNANGDAGRYEQVLELFAPDAEMDVSGIVYRGRDEIRTIFTGAAADFSSQPGFRYVRHATTTHQIDLTGPTSAEGRCYFFVVMAHGLDHWGRYRDRYAVVDGRWCFEHRRVVVDGSFDGRELA